MHANALWQASVHSSTRQGSASAWELTQMIQLIDSSFNEEGQTALPDLLPGTNGKILRSIKMMFRFLQYALYTECPILITCASGYIILKNQ